MRHGFECVVIRRAGILCPDIAISGRKSQGGAGTEGAIRFAARAKHPRCRGQSKHYLCRKQNRQGHQGGAFERRAGYGKKST